MRRSIRDSVVVITGASSGVGRAAALSFARRGATVVVAARNADALEQVAAECISVGARALAIPTDVRDERAVRALSRAAFEAYGKLDVWVNNAAVALYARTDEAPYDAYRQVIETNLLGCVHGARAALPYFQKRGSGVLINNASALGKLGEPQLSSYVVSKFGVVGLGECLRQELRGTPDIQVCTLLPSALDTPLFQHAGNYTGRAVQALLPIYRPEMVAQVMVRLAERPRATCYVGAAGRIAVGFHRLAPDLTARAIARYAERYGYQERAAPHTDGNLFSPMPLWAGVTGGWHGASGASAFVALARGAARLALELPAALLERLPGRKSC